MRIPTIWEAADAAACILFDHDWECISRRPREDIYECLNCGATKRRPR